MERTRQRVKFQIPNQKFQIHTLVTRTLLRTLLSFLGVMACYSAYALLVAPVVTPPPPPRTTATLTAAQREQASNVTRRYDALLATYFPADHWTRQNPKILESDQAMLLIKDYETLEGGRIALNPCLMIFFPEAREEGSAAPSDAVILEAPEGAILQFANGMDLAQAKIGRLEHGVLNGQITIRSDMRQPGPEDDLTLVTQNVQLTESRIWTGDAVRFRLGANHGHGQQMEIRLLPRSASVPENGAGFAGLQSLELVKQVKMHLAFDRPGLLPGEDSSAAKGPQPPVEVTCRGPFHFNLIRQVATFEDQVNVLRLNPDGPSDQLTCELLSIFFEKPNDDPKTLPAATANRRQPSKAPLKPTIVEARGAPVVVRSPSTGGGARCQRLKYDLASRTLSLDDEKEIVLVQHNREIHAPALEYQLHPERGRLGRLWASGPGWLQATESTRKVQVRWQKELRLQRQNGVPVISLLGRPHLESTGMGHLDADQVHLWLKEASDMPGSPTPRSGSIRAEPDRLMAQGNVRIDSPQLTGLTQRLEAWFQAEPAANSSPPQRQATSTARKTSPMAMRPVGPQRSRSSPVGLPVGRTNRVAKQYDIQGQLIRLQLKTRQGKTSVADITVDQQVRFRETRLETPAQRPLVITGDRLQVFHADTETAQVQVRGDQARVEARGMSMAGRTIDLDQRTNRLWIDGTGTLGIPVNKGLDGRPTPSEQTLTIRWTGGMNFDGQRMRFNRQVEAQGQHQTLRTEQMDVTVRQPISFRRTAKSPQVELHEIQCRGGVFLENRSFDGPRQTSLDRMRTEDLRVNHLSGEVYASGAGWLSTVRMRGQNNPLDPTAKPAAQATPASGDQPLEYLRVDFVEAMEGNFHQRQLAFVRQVQCVYGPVETWNQLLDAQNVDGLNEEAVMLDCDRLVVTEMPQPVASRGAIELEAQGNAVIEGRTFTARSDRITYAQAKDLLVLEGTGRNDAQLWRQPYVGGPTSRAAARKILYWKRDNRVEVDDARFFDLSQFGSKKSG